MSFSIGAYNLSRDTNRALITNPGSHPDKSLFTMLKLNCSP
jgi:hypothetical protein